MATKIHQDHITKCVTALLQYLKKMREKKQSTEEKQQMFDEDGSDEYISLIFTLHKIPDKKKEKPITIPIPHSLYGVAGSEVCLFTKDPEEHYQKQLEDKPVDNIAKVIGVKKLRTNYSQYEDRRKLVSAYELFLADDRVIPTLPNLLGKAFFVKKKQPIPVCISRKGFRESIAKARDSTYLFISSGACSAVKIAKSSFTKAEIVDNVMAALPTIVDRLPQKWKNVQSIHVKTATSAALPLYSALPKQTAIPTTVQSTRLDVGTPAEKETDDAKSPTAKKTPAKKAPEKKAGKQTPSQKTPTQKADVKKADVKKADVKKADVKKADVKKADAKKADAKKTPAKSPAAKKTPAKSPAAKKTPAKSPAAKKTPAKKASAKKAKK